MREEEQACKAQTPLSNSTCSRPHPQLPLFSPPQVREALVRFLSPYFPFFSRFPFSLSVIFMFSHTILLPGSELSQGLTQASFSIRSSGELTIPSEHASP